MNTFAIKKMEIINSLSLVSGDSLDRIREYIETLIAELLPKTGFRQTAN